MARSFRRYGGARRRLTGSGKSPAAGREATGGVSGARPARGAVSASGVTGAPSGRAACGVREWAGKTAPGRRAPRRFGYGRSGERGSSGAGAAGGAVRGAAHGIGLIARERRPSGVGYGGGRWGRRRDVASPRRDRDRPGRLETCSACSTRRSGGAGGAGPAGRRGRRQALHLTGRGRWRRAGFAQGVLGYRRGEGGGAAGGSVGGRRRPARGAGPASPNTRRHQAASAFPRRARPTGEGGATLAGTGGQAGAAAPSGTTASSPVPCAARRAAPPAAPATKDEPSPVADWRPGSPVSPARRFPATALDAPRCGGSGFERCRPGWPLPGWRPFLERSPRAASAPPDGVTLAPAALGA